MSDSHQSTLSVSVESSDGQEIMLEVSTHRGYLARVFSQGD
jgi:hypothetical protein